ncbi:uncharacterized protein LOC131880849 [Tigriopus californicus]|uniref:uncharacterized protein LOC131880849 n=1 Tax=Tigriopus californicus TaxID=6832 RepID=UPI0027DA6A3D|nr:uncharacterized protein LOC131880849 [Tigriopus californicus]
MCLQLSSRGTLSSRNCFESLTTICEMDCTNKDECERPDNEMDLHHGRWSAFFYEENDSGKPFTEAQETCQTMNSNLVVLHQLRDSWGLNYVAKSHGGANREAYIGLGALTVSSPCSPQGGCPGLKWLDGTPHEQKVVHWETTTNGSTSVECFIMKHFYGPGRETYKIIGVNDCHKKRAFVCVSHCLRQRCPIPRFLKKAKNTWTYFNHVEGDKVK